MVSMLKTYEYCRCIVWRMYGHYQFEIEYMRNDEDGYTFKTGWSCLSQNDNGIYGLYSNTIGDQKEVRLSLNHTLVEEFMVYVDIDTKEVFRLVKYASGVYDILKFDKGNWIPKEETK